MVGGGTWRVIVLQLLFGMVPEKLFSSWIRSMLCLFVVIGWALYGRVEKFVTSCWL